MNIAAIWGAVWPIAVAILLFLLIIVVHEFGHFIIAKIMGVRVNEFAIGFGPTLVKWQGKETKYAIRLIPFGGFCAMEGEEEDSDDPKAFCNKKPIRRFFIVVAGAVFNIILGLVIMMVYFAPEKVLPTTTVHSFIENSTTQASGLKEGDTILKVDGRSCLTVVELNYAFTAVKDGEVDLLVRRNGKKVLLEDVRFDTAEADGIKFLQRDFYYTAEKNDFGTYISQSVKHTVSYGRMVWFSLVDLIRGRYNINQVSGPVQVVGTMGEAAQMGLDFLLPILCLITINLGVFNLLPLPALDGGRLVFILFEMIFRKPVPQKYESLVHGIGFVALMLIMVLIVFKDIIGLF